MREIIILIKNNQIITNTDFAGYAGERNATVLKFELAPELENENYIYKANITLPDGITTSVQLNDMSLILTSTLTACEGTIPIQLVITEADSLIYKSGIINLKIKPSLAPTTIIGNGTGIENIVINDEGNLIVTLLDGKEINAGYVKGDKGEQGSSYSLTNNDKQEIARKLSNEIIKGIIEHNITALEVPDGTTCVSSYQFQNNRDLRKVIATSSVEVIENNAFENCFKLTGIEGLRGLKIIGNNAFARCFSLTDIAFSETIESIGSSAFRECYSLEGDIFIPNCAAVGEFAFYNAVHIKTIHIPNCKIIGNNAFGQCGELTYLDLSGAETISSAAFISCSSLQVVKLCNNFNCNGVNLSQCNNLSVETLVDIINSLKDRTGETAYTLTLASTNLAKLTNEQKTIATNKNWVLK